MMHWEVHFALHSPPLFVFRSSFLFLLIYWLVTADRGSVGGLFLFLSRVVASSPDTIKHLQVSLMSCSCMNSACVCRTIKLWDLEKFTMIGSLEGDTTPVRWVFPVAAGCNWNVTSDPCPCGFRCICFSPDGSCLYSGATDSLRVFGWEPDRCFDAVPVGWGKVSDLAICNQQLVCSSAHRSVTVPCRSFR